MKQQKPLVTARQIRASRWTMLRHIWNRRRPFENSGAIHGPYEHSTIEPFYIGAVVEDFRHPPSKRNDAGVLAAC
jgi:hypothetical protein